MRKALAARGIDIRSAQVRQVANRYAVILVDHGRGERVVLWQRDPGLAVTPEQVRPEWLADATLVHVDATDEDASEVAALGQRLSVADDDLTRLRALLVSLRSRASEIRAAAA